MVFIQHFVLRWAISEEKITTFIMKAGREIFFGQWKPGRILFAALFFGLMKTIAATYSVIPWLVALNIPSDIYKMIPYIATLVVLAFTARNSQAPRAEGIPYDKGER